VEEWTDSGSPAVLAAQTPILRSRFARPEPSSTAMRIKASDGRSASRVSRTAITVTLPCTRYAAKNAASTSSREKPHAVWLRVVGSRRRRSRRPPRCVRGERPRGRLESSSRFGSRLEFSRSPTSATTNTIQHKNKHRRSRRGSGCAPSSPDQGHHDLHPGTPPALNPLPPWPSADPARPASRRVPANDQPSRTPRNPSVVFASCSPSHGCQQTFSSLAVSPRVPRIRAPNATTRTDKLVRSAGTRAAGVRVGGILHRRIPFHLPRTAYDRHFAAGVTPPLPRPRGGGLPEDESPLSGPLRITQYLCSVRHRPTCPVAPKPSVPWSSFLLRPLLPLGPPHPPPILSTFLFSFPVLFLLSIPLFALVVSLEVAFSSPFEAASRPISRYTRRITGRGSFTLTSA